MKIVVSSTEEQEKYMDELVGKMYKEVFPKFFSEEKIEQFKNMEILIPTDQDRYHNSTLQDCFHIISSLQALLAIIEDNNPLQYKEKFDQNVKKLQEYGYQFPLSINEIVSINEGSIKTSCH
ncbi:DUF5365 family protein [Bacillus carboniphilus]|uniref:DUF5365 family protein n=1 Tax=Bacillus carboniphilus TaxID=86663 RepID=A0ABY9JTL1_9BACI|nr:DUF5365 family protein [Bacillus carboniphilus]WLR42741.1 DUF5365 family protein [Bacillus carboniphilus]